jgi:hypothetical protein
MLEEGVTAIFFSVLSISNIVTADAAICIGCCLLWVQGASLFFWQLIHSFFVKILVVIDSCFWGVALRVACLKKCN